MANDFQAEPSRRPVEIFFPLPKAPDTKIHLRLTIQSSYLLLFLTSAINGDTSTTVPLSSFVCAIPDRLNPGQALSTPLYSSESTVEFATRLSKLLARRAKRPVYVGNSISFAGAGMGGTVEEEMEGFKRVVEVVMEKFEKS